MLKISEQITPLKKFIIYSIKLQKIRNLRQIEEDKKLDLFHYYMIYFKYMKNAKTDLKSDRLETFFGKKKLTDFLFNFENS